MLMITLYVSEQDAMKLMNMRGVNMKIKNELETLNSSELIKMGYTRQMLSYYRDTYPEIVYKCKRGANGNRSRIVYNYTEMQKLGIKPSK